MKSGFLLILLLFFLVGCSEEEASDDTSGVSCLDTGLPSTLKSDLAAIMATHKIVGMSVYLSHPTHGDYAAALGFADKENSIAATTQTYFASASYGKAFTVAGALSLVDKGSLSLTDNMKTYYPSMVDTTDGPVQLFHLMNHTSRVAAPFETQYSVLQAAPNTVTDYEDHISDALGMAYVAGTLGVTYDYSSANTNLLGYAMATVTGKSWQQVVQEEILTPNNLNDIFFYEYSPFPTNAAKFYPDFVADSAQTEIPYAAAVMKYGGAGGTLYGTSCDYGRFAKLFFSGGMHSASVAAAQTTYRVTYGASVNHFAQLGSFYYDGGGASPYKVIFHQGGGQGFSTYGAHLPDLGWSYFYAFNTSTEGTMHDDINNAIATVLLSL